MSRRANHVKVGMFVIASFAVFAGGVTALGVAELFRDPVLVETYLDESVQGLEVGSPVKLRGVKIGQVEQITFVHEAYPEANTEQRRFVMLVMSLEHGPFRASATVEERRLIAERSVGQGLRCRLASQGLTGVAYIEIDFLNPKEHKTRLLSWQPKHMHLPSAPSTYTEVAQTLESISDRFEQLDIEGLVGRIDKLVGTIDSGVRDARIGQLSADLRRLMNGVSETIERGDVARISSQVVGLLEDVRVTNRKVQGFIDGPELTRLREDLAATGSSVRRMAEKAEPKVDRSLAGLEESLAALKRTGKRIEGLLAGPELERTLANADVTSRKVREASGELPALTDDLRESVGRVNTLLMAQQQSLQRIMTNLEVMSRNLRELSGDARRNPSRVLFGRPPPKREGR